MSTAGFHVCDALAALGIEHGLGTAASQDAQIEGLLTVRQVHGTRVLRVPADEPAAQADALFTEEPGVAVGVRTADCVPILLVDEGRRGVAAVHAGWRGTAAGMAEAAANALATALAVPAERLIAVLGPHIGPCCYEVDDPVRLAVRDTRVFRDAPRRGHYMLDLGELNTLQLLRAGLARERVHRVGGCTHCQPERYASYRRDGTGGRMLNWVRMPAGEPPGC